MTEQQTEQPYTVVVGVSATSKSPTALAWAQAQARQNGVRPGGRIEIHGPNSLSRLLPTPTHKSNKYSTVLLVNSS